MPHSAGGSSLLSIPHHPSCGGQPSMASASTLLLRIPQNKRKPHYPQPSSRRPLSHTEARRITSAMAAARKWFTTFRLVFNVQLSFGDASVDRRDPRPLTSPLKDLPQGRPNRVQMNPLMSAGANMEMLVLAAQRFLSHRAITYHTVIQWRLRAMITVTAAACPRCPVGRNWRQASNHPLNLTHGKRDKRNHAILIQRSPFNQRPNSIRKRSCCTPKAKRGASLRAFVSVLYNP